MPLRSKIAIAFAFLIALLAAGVTAPGMTAPSANAGLSPAQCGPSDMREPGIQGDVPAGQTASYNCGVKLVGQLPTAGSVAGDGKCAYVRPWREGKVHVIDVSDPANPVEVSTIPVQGSSESMRAVVTDKRAVLVSGSSVYDISDCLHPALMGEIKWPPLSLPGIPVKLVPHDLRITRDAMKVYASFGVWEVDISDLHHPDSWKVIDHRCEIIDQIPGPWQAADKAARKTGVSLCDDAGKPSPMGANYLMAASPLEASLLWPQVSHSPDFNADDTRLYVGDQAGGTSGILSPVPYVRIIDLTKSPLKIIGEVPSPGHGLDWFRAGGREYVLGSNEGGTQGIMGQPDKGDTCKPYPRPSALGWGFEGIVSDVTNPAKAHRVSMLPIAINEPEFCMSEKPPAKTRGLPII